MTILKVPDFIGKIPGLKRFRMKAAVDPKKQEKPDGNAITVIQEFTDRSRKDIDTWQTALTTAENPENPKWNLLQDLYDYLLVDAHTHSVVELRKAATLSSRFYIYDKVTGEEQPEKTAWLQSQWFYTFLSNVLESELRGYMVAQLVNPSTMKFFYVPHRNIIPQLGVALAKVQDNVGVKYREDAAFKDDVIEVRSNYQFGYMNDLVPQVFWKRNAQQSWAEFSEKFGMPGLVAVTETRDDKSINKLNEMLKTFGESLTAVLPKGTTLTPLQWQTGADGHKVYNEQIERCNAEISKRVIGGTMVSDNGSSRSQSEVHERNLDEKIGESDKRLCEFATNDQLIPIMKRYGWGFTDNDAFAFDRSQNVSLKEMSEILSTLMEHYEVDESWVKKTFQIPITGKKQSGSPVSFNEASTALAAALGAKGVTLPKYVGACGHNHLTQFSASFVDNLLEELSLSLINDIWEGRDTLTTEVLKSIAGYRQLLDGLFDGWSNRMEVTYDATDHHCLAMMEYNLFEFSRMKEKANVFALNEILNKGKENNFSFNQFRDEAMKYLKNPDQNWLRSEHNYTIAVGQNASRYHQFMNEIKTVTNYGIIQTVGDSNVRPAHQLLEGKIVRFDEKGGVKIWPPFDIGCRCEILQHIGRPSKDQLISSDEIYELINKKPGDKWTGNKGVIEQVFTANEMYLKQQGISSEVNKLLYSDYKLKSWNDIKQNYPALNIDTTINVHNVGEFWKPIEENSDHMGFTDYAGRKMVLKKKVFEEHTTNQKYVQPSEARHQLFPHVESVLQEPDEVYFFQYKDKKFQTRYIKFFNDKAIVVNTGVGSNNVEVNTWYEMKGDDKNRKGYLIHKK